jgi:2-phosphoglycerate kinase
MKRRAEHLVEKRDGRREFLRATKLARSVHLALHSVGVDEDWRALEVANVVLQALRRKRELGGEDSTMVLKTSEIADAVQHALVVTGQPHAAAAYGMIATERSRRRQSVALLGRVGGMSVQAAAMTDGIGFEAAPARRLPQE